MAPNTDSRIVAITGAGSGIGRACASRLADKDTKIVALDRNGEAAEEAAAQILRAGCSAVAAQCDVTDREGVRNALARFPVVRVLVNCAGVEDEKRIEDIEPDDLRRMFDVNVIGLFNASQVALARMPAGGRIIHIGSRAYLGSRNHAHYAASKAAVVGLARTMAMEVAARQITVNTVAPGPVRTPLLAGRSDEELARMAASYPGGQLPEAEDVAHAVAFFADAASGFITGQVLLVDGGRSLGGST